MVGYQMQHSSGTGLSNVGLLMTFLSTTQVVMNAAGLGSAAVKSYTDHLTSTAVTDAGIDLATRTVDNLNEGLSEWNQMVLGGVKALGAIPYQLAETLNDDLKIITQTPATWYKEATADPDDEPPELLSGGEYAFHATRPLAMGAAAMFLKKLASKTKRRPPTEPSKAAEVVEKVAETVALPPTPPAPPPAQDNTMLIALGLAMITVGYTLGRQ